MRINSYNIIQLNHLKINQHIATLPFSPKVNISPMSGTNLMTQYYISLSIGPNRLSFSRTVCFQYSKESQNKTQNSIIVKERCVCE